MAVSHVWDSLSWFCEKHRIYTKRERENVKESRTQVLEP
jgi:hypothetical protein